MYHDAGEDPSIYQRKLQDLQKMYDNRVLDREEYERLKSDLRLQMRVSLGLDEEDTEPVEVVPPSEFLSSTDLEIRKILALSEIRLSDTPEDLIALDGE